MQDSQNDFKNDIKFSDSHEWVFLKQEVATIGISNHAQSELGEIVYVELPQVGASLQKGSEMAVLESTKAAVDVYMPLSGEVVEVNLLLKDHPEMINQSPEEKGWICKVKIANLSEYDLLMNKESYRAMLR